MAQSNDNSDYSVYNGQAMRLQAKQVFPFPNQKVSTKLTFLMTS